MNFGANVRVNKMGWCIIVMIVFMIIYIRSDSHAENLTSKGELVNLKDMLIGAIKVAELGGKQVVAAKSHKLNTKSKGKTKEGANDPVTDADYASNCVMYNTLTKTFPSVTVISEEKITDANSCEVEEVMLTTPQRHRNIAYLNDEYVFAEDVTFWIDPLDATQEYTENLTDYVTTMVCVAVKGVPILGVIHKPFQSRTSWAWFTKSHSVELPELRHQIENKNHPRVIVSRSHKGQVETFAHKAFGEESTVQSAGGAGYKVLEVVNGRSEIYIHTTTIKKWDICAGNAIINAMNGKMTTLSGKSIDYSPNSDVKNTEGLLVSLYDHEYYLNRTLPLLGTL